MAAVSAHPVAQVLSNNTMPLRGQRGAHLQRVSCMARRSRLVPQVRVLPLDANLGRRRFGPGRREFSIHDLWLSTPIRSPPPRSPGRHNAGNCSPSSLPAFTKLGCRR